MLFLDRACQKITATAMHSPDGPEGTYKYICTPRFCRLMHRMTRAFERLRLQAWDSNIKKCFSRSWIYTKLIGRRVQILDSVGMPQTLK